MLDIFDDFRGDVFSGDFFDAKARRGVDLENERAARGAHDVDTANMETHGFCGFEGDTFFFVVEFNRDTGATLVKVRAEVGIKRGTLH